MINFDKQYKKSGIPWIGDIPVDWEATKLKNIAKLVNGYAFKSDLYSENGVFIVRITNVDDEKLNTNSPVYYPFNRLKEFRGNLLKENDILMTLTGNVGLVGIVDKQYPKAALNQRVGCIRTKKVSNKFLFYLFATDVFRKHAILNADGTAQLNLSTDWLMSNKLFVPQLSKQQQIVNYLDKKVGIIDKLIENINQQIEDLRLFKFSMISEYTSSQTLNKYKIKYKNTIVDKKSEFDGQPYFALENIVSGSGEYIDTDAEYSTKGATVCKENDICFGKLRPYLRKYFFVTKKTTCSTEFAVFREKIPTKYMYYLIQSEEFLQLCNAFSEGTKMPRINIEKLKNWKFGFPSVEEQKIFVKNMDAVSTKIEQLIQIKRQKIMELKEYKKSLIYECVTGKKEVL